MLLLIYEGIYFETFYQRRHWEWPDKSVYWSIVNEILQDLITLLGKKN